MGTWLQHGNRSSTSYAPIQLVGEVQLDFQMVQCMSVWNRPTQFSYIGNEGRSRSIVGEGAHLSSHDLHN